MLLALIVIPIAALFEIGGWNEAIQIVGQINPEHFNMVKGIGFLAIISSVAWGLGYFGQPHIIVRFMAIKSAQDVPKARLIGMTWMVLGLYGAILTGFIGLAFISSQDVAMLSNLGINVITENGIQVLEDPEKIFIAFSQILFNPFVSGVLLAAILAAIMSTIDSQLLVSSSAVAEDFYKSIFRRKATDKELITVGRIATLVIAIIAAIIAISPSTRKMHLDYRNFWQIRQSKMSSRSWSAIMPCARPWRCVCCRASVPLKSSMRWTQRIRQTSLMSWVIQKSLNSSMN